MSTVNDLYTPLIGRYIVWIKISKYLIENEGIVIVFKGENPNLISENMINRPLDKEYKELNKLTLEFESELKNICRNAVPTLSVKRKVVHVGDYLDHATT